MSKVVIDIDAKDIANIKDGDILVFSEEKNCFYRQTAQEFWAKHNEELARIIKRYDELVKTLEEKIKTLEEREDKFELLIEKHENEHEQSVQEIITEHEEHEKEFEEKIREYLTKNKNITNKLIVMVENFIKTGGTM